MLKVYLIKKFGEKNMSGEVGKIIINTKASGAVKPFWRNFKNIIAYYVIIN